MLQTKVLLEKLPKWLFNYWQILIWTTEWSTDSAWLLLYVLQVGTMHQSQRRRWKSHWCLTAQFKHIKDADIKRMMTEMWKRHGVHLLNNRMEVFVVVLFKSRLAFFFTKSCSPWCESSSCRFQTWLETIINQTMKKKCNLPMSHANRVESRCVAIWADKVWKQFKQQMNTEDLVPKVKIVTQNLQQICPCAQN